MNFGGGKQRAGGKGGAAEGNFPSRELDKVFRKIAWQAVVDNPLSGVTDRDGDGVGERE